MLVHLGLGIPTLVDPYLPGRRAPCVPVGDRLLGQPVRCRPTTPQKKKLTKKRKTKNKKKKTKNPKKKQKKKKTKNQPGMAHPTLTDAGGKPVSRFRRLPTYDRAMSFGLIRGGPCRPGLARRLEVEGTGRSRTLDDSRKMCGNGGRHGPRLRAGDRAHCAHAKGKPKIVSLSLPITSTRRVRSSSCRKLARDAFPDAQRTLVETDDNGSFRAPGDRCHRSAASGSGASFLDGRCDYCNVSRGKTT